jgi:hypothetical protein
MSDTFDIYVALWRRAEQLGARVRYDGSLADGEGSFHPNPNGEAEPRPTIDLGRPYYREIDQPSRLRNDGGYALPAPDLADEVVTLAHECGHFLSWKDRTPRQVWNAYLQATVGRDEVWDAVREDGSLSDESERIRAASKRSLAVEDMTLILEEEQRAWTIGGELLEQVGFTDFASYARRERLGLHFHRYRLGLDDLWPEDLAMQAAVLPN